MTFTTSLDWIEYLLLCGGMGVAGQCLRAVAGAKKVNDQAKDLNARFKDVFDGAALLTSLITGLVAGIAAGLTVEPKELDRSFLLGVLAAGYAGADFVDAFLKKSVPDIQKVARAANAAGGPENVPAVQALGQPGPFVANAIRARGYGGNPNA